jgi:hypothetical protein
MKPGRPTKFTPARQEKILSAIRRGLPYVHACAVAGIHPSSFHAYKNRHASFRDEVEKANADFIASNLEVIEKAAKAGDWRAAAWRLEHCQPEHFAKNRDGGKAVSVNVGVAVYLPKKDALQDTQIVRSSVDQIADK